MVLFPHPMRNPLAYDGSFWRKLARLGAQRGPEWWLCYSPPVFGLVAAIAVPSARRAVLRNLHRIRGDTGRINDVIDTARTFTTYAGALAESLASGSKNSRMPDEVLVGREHIDESVRGKKGVIIATAHSGGWEVAGPLFANHYSMEIMMVMEPERDARARQIHDEARRSIGLNVVHVGSDPLSALPLLRHLQCGQIVALQVDRVPEGMRSHRVRLLGADGTIPEGPLRLAQLSGAPILPVFCARLGFRTYLIEAHPPVYVPRRATAKESDAAAQTLADTLSAFLTAHPTQWFHFGSPVVG